MVRCDVPRVPPKINSPWGRCACVLLVVTAMFTSGLSLCSAFPLIFIPYVVFKQNGPFYQLISPLFYSNLNWYIVYRSTKSEINEIKIDQQTGWYSKNQRRSIRKSLEKGQYEMKG